MATWTVHPSVVTVNGELRLKIFKNLKSDPSLPKNLVDGMVVLKNKKPMTLEEYLRSSDGMSMYRLDESRDGYQEQNKKLSIFQKIVKWFSKKNRVVPPETFALAKDLIETNVISKDINDMAGNLKSLIDKTLANGQVALAKRLENEHKNILNEVLLLKNGYNHYLMESDVIELFKKADRGIRIDFWNDYPDLVPEEVINEKKKADSLCLFDNWCVMHYDPDGSTLKQMKDEEWRRDPILFGMMLGSDRLYFVKDWTTAKDDLTIDKVCKTLNIDQLREARKYGVESPYGDIDNIVISMNSDLQAVYGALDDCCTEPQQS